MSLNYYTTSNTSSNPTYQYTVNYYSYSGYNSTARDIARPRTKQEYKNKEVKWMLQKERGW